MNVSPPTYIIISVCAERVFPVLLPSLIFIIFVRERERESNTYIFMEECSSNESGWTKYIDPPSAYHDDDDTGNLNSVDDGYGYDHHRRRRRKDDHHHRDDDDDDGNGGGYDSFASDASSGAPGHHHHHDDDDDDDDDDAGDEDKHHHHEGIDNKYTKGKKSGKERSEKCVDDRGKGEKKSAASYFNVFKRKQGKKHN